MAKITINQDSLKSRKEWVRHQVQPGHNIYRIMPPFGNEEVHNNYPYRKWSIVWGLADPTTGKMRPVASPLSTAGERKCPVNEYVTALAAKADAKTKELEARGFSKEEIRDTLKGLNSLIWNMRPKHIYAYNACNKSGEVGILELKSTAHQALKREMMQYIKDYSQDPTSLNHEEDDSGVWFDIIREGEKGAKDTKYDVRKNQKKVKNGAKISFEDDREALNENVVDTYDTSGYNLHSLYQSKTYSELYDLLMANMPGILDSVPEALVEGFDPNEERGVTEIGSYAGKVVTPGKSKVNLSLSDGDDDAPARQALSKGDESVFELANSILEG